MHTQHYLIISTSTIHSAWHSSMALTVYRVQPAKKWSLECSQRSNCYPPSYTPPVHNALTTLDHRHSLSTCNSLNMALTVNRVEPATKWSLEWSPRSNCLPPSCTLPVHKTHTTLDHQQHSPTHSISTQARHLQLQE